jgi:hypothetical protein
LGSNQDQRSKVRGLLEIQAATTLISLQGNHLTSHLKEEVALTLPLDLMIIKRTTEVMAQSLPTGLAQMEFTKMAKLFAKFHNSRKVNTILMAIFNTM